MGDGCTTSPTVSGFRSKRTQPTDFPCPLWVRWRHLRATSGASLRVGKGCLVILDSPRPPPVAMPRASQSLRLPGGPDAPGGASSSVRANASAASSSSVHASSLLGRSLSDRGGDKGGASPAWTPLAEDFFAPPLLSQKEKSYLVRKACEAAQELVERARSADGPIQWRHVEKADDVQVYAGQPRGAPSASTTSLSMCAVMSVPGTVKEVAALFDLSTTRQLKQFVARHGAQSLFYDAVVLHTLAPRTREKPLHQVTAKWMAIKTPRGMEDRDFCYLECQDKFIDSLGRKGWVLCQHSIKLPGCDDLSREYGLVRGSIYHSGLIVVEAEQKRGYVDIIHVLQMNLKKNAPMPPSFLRDRVLVVARVRAMMRAKRLNEQRYLSDLELVPKKYRSRCTVCQDSFSLLLLRKLNCRKCGEVVCGACSKEFTIESAQIRTDTPVKLRICMKCYQVVTAAPQGAEAVLETPRASTSFSFLEYCDDVRSASFITQGSVNNDGYDQRRTQQQQQQRPTKIFLQSMRRPGTSSSSSFAPTQSMGNYGPRGPAPANRGMSSRTSERMRPSDFRPTQSMGNFQHQPSSSRYTMMGYQPQPSARAPPTPTSIFDRPANSNALRRQNSSNATINAGYADAGGASGITTNSTSRSRLQELASQEFGLNASSTYAMPRDSYEVPFSPLDVSALRTTEGSLALPSPLDMNSLRLTEASNPAAPSPAQYRTAPSPVRMAQPPAPRVPVSNAHRDRAASDSSNSSTGSIDIDSYDVDGASRPPQDTSSNPGAGMGDFRKNSDASSTDSFDPMVAFKANNIPPPVSPSPRQHRTAREEVEETKEFEFAKTPALPPPSPSAHATTQEVLERQSTADMAPIYQGTANGNDRIYGADSVNHGDSDDSGSEEGNIDDDYVESQPIVNRAAAAPIQHREPDDSMILNTARCDVSYLDDEMRQFHDQSLFVTPNDRPSSRASSSYRSGPNSDAMSDVSGSYYSDAPPPALPTSPTRTRDRIQRDRSAFYGKPPRQSVGSSRSSVASSAASSRRPPRPITPMDNTGTSPANPRPSVRWAPSPTHSTHESYRAPRNPATASYANASAVSSVPTEARFAINGSLVSNIEFRQQREDEGDLSYRRSEVQRSNSAGSSDYSGGSSSPRVVPEEFAAVSAVPAEANGSFNNGHPTYLPARFKSPTNHQSKSISNDNERAPQQIEAPKDATTEVAERLDAFTLDFSTSFATNQAQNVRREAAGGSNIQRVQFYGPPEGSVLDSVPEASTRQPAPHVQRQWLHDPADSDPIDGRSAASEDDDSDDEQLLSARDLYQSFGDTGKLASLVGNSRDDPRFLRTFSQLQRNLSADSSDEE